MGHPKEEPPPISVPESHSRHVMEDDHPPISREQRRSRRKREVRARTVSMKRMTKRELEIGRQHYPLEETAGVERPKTRADCANVERPCPFVSCKHHLYLDVSARTGAIKLNFPDLEPWEMKESCTLDVAADDGLTLEAVGEIMNLTRERVRQIEVRGLAKITALQEMRELRDVYGAASPMGKRKLPLLSVVRDEPSKPDEGAFDAEHFASDDLDDD